MNLSRPDKLEVEVWRDAVWDYLLEHSDILDSGTIFIKFHTKGRSQFEGHVRSRIKGYHREDPREKERRHEDRRKTFIEDKESKREKYLREKLERKVLMEMVKKRNELRSLPIPKKYILMAREFIRRKILETHGYFIKLKK